jgi:hypothetical protein
MVGTPEVGKRTTAVSMAGLRSKVWNLNFPKTMEWKILIPNGVYINRLLSH